MSSQTKKFKENKGHHYQANVIVCQNCMERDCICGKKEK